MKKITYIIILLFFCNSYAQKIKFGFSKKENYYIIIINQNLEKYTIKFFKNDILEKTIKPKKIKSSFKLSNLKGYLFTNKIIHNNKEIHLYFNNDFNHFLEDIIIDFQEDYD